MKLEELLMQMRGLDQVACAQAQARWSQIARPLDSLGLLEPTVVKIAGIRRTGQINVEKKALVIMCAGNDVMGENISQTRQEIITAVTEDFTKEDSYVCTVARRAGVDVFPADIGIFGELENYGNKYPLTGRKIVRGTRDFRKESAMTMEECLKAMETGIEMVKQLKSDGYRLIATGEMRVGNTTTSSAVASALTGQPPAVMTRKRAGLSDEGLKKKIQVIRESVSRYWPEWVEEKKEGKKEGEEVGEKDSVWKSLNRSLNCQPAGACHLYKTGAIDILSKVDSFDIADLTGVSLGGAIYGIPVIIDGFISSTAALAATSIYPMAVDYMLASHVSSELTGHLVLEYLFLQLPITAYMCLGEGTGAAASMPLLDMTVDIYHRMSTFEKIRIEGYQSLQQQ